MENVVVGRIVHVAIPYTSRIGPPVCRPLLIVAVNSRTSVNGHVLLDGENDRETVLAVLGRRNDMVGWMTSVTEEEPRTQGPGDTDKREPHLANTWHDPRLC